jgi:hypothetical protein
MLGRNPTSFLEGLRAREVLTGDLLGQLNDWLDQPLSAVNARLDEKRNVQTLAIAILENTDEPILRHKALLLCSGLVEETQDPHQEERLRVLIRSMLADFKSNIWEQVGALLLGRRIEHPTTAANHLATALDASRRREDGFFLRANLMEHARDDRELFHFLEPQLPSLLHDASAYVRIRGLELLCVRQEYALLFKRCEDGDADPQVQTALFHSFAELLFACDAEDLQRIEPLFSSLNGQFKLEARIAFLLNMNEHLMRALRQNLPIPKVRMETLENILHIIRRDEHDVLRRHSSFAYQCLQILQHQKQRDEFLRLHEALGQSRKFEEWVLPKETEVSELAPLLTVLAYSDLGYELMETPSTLNIRPAYGTSFSLWRFIHEMKRPSGNKRQGAAHWRSRHLQGSIRIPSSLTCELVATTVPGEPLYIPEAGGWRPWLPLLCDIYRMIFRFPLLKIFTPDGVTTVKRPNSWSQRFRAWTHLVFAYERVSRLRNWTTRHGGDPAAYIKHLSELGFSIRFEPAVAGEKDVTVMKFFGSES